MAHDSDVSTHVLLGLRLKGFAGVDAVAQATGLADDAISGALDGLVADELVMFREGTQISGYALTKDGRARGEQLLADELDTAGVRDTVDGAYRRFLDLNQHMLQLCTDWQVRDVDGEQVLNDHEDAAYDESVTNRLVALHDELRPVLVDLREALSRYEPYSGRFREALEKLLGGDLDYFTKPIMPSYHTVWFELHEDLLATLGIDRASEGAA